MVRSPGRYSKNAYSQARLGNQVGGCERAASDGESWATHAYQFGPSSEETSNSTPDLFHDLSPAGRERLRSPALVFGNARRSSPPAGRRDERVACARPPVFSSTKTPFRSG